jgi:hypothetical protein
VIVHAFLKTVIVPDAELLDVDRERPDALIRVSGNIVGLEVTAVTEALRRQSVAPQRWTAEATRIVKATNKSYDELSSRPLVVALEFRPDWVPPKPWESSRLASDLATWVYRVSAGVPETPGARETFVDPHPALSWAYVGHSQLLPGRWSVSLGHSDERVTAQDITTTVSRKEAELAEYLKVAQEVWLLIDCDVSGQSVALDVPVPDPTIVTGFRRVYCCGFGRWPWVEVPCVRPSSSTSAG